jgi:proteasome lid subunit RPN8/RPN11
MNKYTIRVPRDLVAQIRADLARGHPFAAERVGFVFGRVGKTQDGEVVVLCQFRSVEDEHYEEDDWVGARIGQQAMAAALQHALQQGAATFHVHVHDHFGTPWFSGIDLKQLPPIMKPFAGLVPRQPHGLLLLSRDQCVAFAWRRGDKTPRATRRVTIVGAPLALLGRGRS